MGTAPPNRWVRHTVAGLARTVLAVVAGLVVWTILPTALGWQPSVVMSGSMEPAIRVGDVVLAREVPATALRPGQVLLVEDPTRPEHLLLHRYDHADDDGALVLRGDANEQEDSAAVDPAHVRGVGVLRVPWVGLLHTWLAAGRFAPVALTALGLLALTALAPVREREVAAHAAGEGDDGDERGDGSGEPDTPGTDADTGARLRARHVAVVGAALLLTLTLGGPPSLHPASATFTATTSTSASFSTGTWSTSTAPLPGE
ncbi:MAG TPA: S24/S26 family peptidase [Phototrophicaceae bacterium]|nr:S24/S26 family peptidase [Phototrophicaceae bacterium]